MKRNIEVIKTGYKRVRSSTEHQVDVTLDAADVCGWGKTVVCVNVQRKDGTVARFWMSVRICGDSRAGRVGACYANVSACVKGAKNVSKEVSASWINFDAQLAAIVTKGGGK